MCRALHQLHGALTSTQLQLRTLNPHLHSSLDLAVGPQNQSLAHLPRAPGPWVPHKEEHLLVGVSAFAFQGELAGGKEKEVKGSFLWLAETTLGL